MQWIILILIGIIWLIFWIFSEITSSLSKASDIKNQKKNLENKRKLEFPDRVIDNSMSLLERNMDIIESYNRKIVSSSSSRSYRYYYIDNMTRDCINDICLAESKYEESPNNKYLSSWEYSAPPEWKVLSNEIKLILRNREKELDQIEKVDEMNRQKEKLENLIEKYSDLLNQFNEVVYRKVKTIDGYGEENWDAVDKEAIFLVEKIAKREGHSESKIKDWRKFTWGMPHEYIDLIPHLKNEFNKYYKVRQSNSINNTEIKSMSGIEFENYLASLLKLNGFESVSGTPKTGDQGADLIAKKNGRTIVIQAKRYESTVGNKAVQEVVAAVHFYNGHEGWVITNSSFTKSARELAGKSGVTLVDGLDLMQFSNFIKNL